MHRASFTSPRHHENTHVRFETAAAIATELNLHMHLGWHDGSDSWLTAENVSPFGGFPGWWSFQAKCAAVFDAFDIPDEDWVAAILEYSSRVWGEIDFSKSSLSDQQLTLLMALVAERVHHRSPTLNPDNPAHP